MIYLLCDTNIWIYLANSKDPYSQKQNEGHTQKLYNDINTLVQNNKIKVLTSPIILNEWERNQEQAKLLIKNYEDRKKSHLDGFERIISETNSSESPEIIKVKADFEEKIKTKIDSNKKHIQSINNLLREAISVPLNIETKAFITDWAIEKKAPFIGDKKNSTADAAIFFSMLEYAKSLPVTDSIVFVSSNKGDFSDPKDDNRIHPDLIEFVNEANIKYFKSLPLALKYIDETIQFTEEQIKEIDEEIDDYFNDLEYCQVCDPGEDYPLVNYLNVYEPEEIENENATVEDPDQLKIDFEDQTVLPKKEYTNTIQTAECAWCNELHIICQNCHLILPTSAESPIITCDCGIKYYVDNSYARHKSGEGYEIKIMKDEIHCRLCSDEIETTDFTGDYMCYECENKVVNE